MSPMTNNMNTVRVTSTEYRALKDSGQMIDIGDNQGTYGGETPNYPIWDGRTLEWVMVVVGPMPAFRESRARYRPAAWPGRAGYALGRSGLR